MDHYFKLEMGGTQSGPITSANPLETILTAWREMLKDLGKSANESLDNSTTKSSNSNASKSNASNSSKTPEYAFSDNISKTKSNFYIQYGGSGPQIDALFAATSDVSATVFISHTPFTASAPTARQYSLSSQMLITVYDKDNRSSYDQASNAITLRISDQIHLVIRNRNSFNEIADTADIITINYNCTTNKFQNKGPYTIYQNTRTLLKNKGRCYFADYGISLNSTFVKTLSATQNVFLHSRASFTQIQNMINTLNNYDFNSLDSSTTITFIFANFNLEGDRLDVPDKFQPEYGKTSDGKTQLIIQVKNRNYCYQKEQNMIIASNNQSATFIFNLLTEEYNNGSKDIFNVTESVPLFSTDDAIQYRIQISDTEVASLINEQLLYETIGIGVNGGIVVLSKYISKTAEIIPWFRLIAQLAEAVKNYPEDSEYVWYGSVLYIIQIPNSISKPDFPTDNLRFDWVNTLADRVLVFEYTKTHTHFHVINYVEFYAEGRLDLNDGKAEMTIAANKAEINKYDQVKITFLQNIDISSNVAAYQVFSQFKGRLWLDDVYYRKGNLFVLGKVKSNRLIVATYINMLDTLYKDRLKNTTDDFAAIAILPTVNKEMLPTKFPFPIETYTALDGTMLLIISRGRWVVTRDFSRSIYKIYYDSNTDLVINWEESQLLIGDNYLFHEHEYFRDIGGSQIANGIAYRK